VSRVLLTGANGFVGSFLCDALSSAGHSVRAALRADHPLADGVEKAIVGEIGSGTRWREALVGVDWIVHLAARAHVMHAGAENAALYDEVNARGTLALATAAAAAGVQRLVYVSSIKVNGEETAGRRLFTAADEPSPRDAYGRSKWMGEQHLREVAARTSMEAVVVRPPLVYGPGVRANFLRLMQWVDREWPLPLGAVHNRRSLVSVWNLCGLLVESLQHPAAAGRTWMVSDGEDLSTPDLIRRIGRNMSRRVRLLPVPITLLSSCARLLGRQSEVARLTGSLEVEVGSTRRELGWSPAVTVDEGLARTVAWYRTTRRRT
jgi:nucleoside-diphosphate-sugar epimerase